MHRLFLFLFSSVFALSMLHARPAWAASRLAGETSPYLRLHAADAVDWRPWGDAAFAEAKAADKPVLLAIGYFSCRWCHVMQRESYADPATGEIINRAFIPVLVDREERPDVDAAYMLQAAEMSLPTGWPLTLFLTPDGRAFFGGTYFPKEAIGGALPFAHVLNEIAALWQADPGAVAAEAEKAAAGLRRAFAPRPGNLDATEIDRARRALLEMADPFHGGFGKPSKFPRAAAVMALWRAWLQGGTKDHAEAAQAALTAMSEGALYDHVGGGFFRYTVDPEWRVPHYEKMLNVNAAMLALLAAVWRETREESFARRAGATVRFLLDEMRLENGAFASALDAESLDAAGRKDEGVYYLWSDDEIGRVLGDDAHAFRAAFALAPPERVEKIGPGEGGTLYRAAAAVADPRRLDAGLAKLKAERGKRARPARDDKLLADWNGMIVAALAEAGLAFAEPGWIAAARAAFAAADARLKGPNGRTMHSWHDGRAGAPATLEGLAQMALAALTLFEATGETAYLDRARAFAGQAIRDHWDEAGDGFFQSAADAAPKLARLKLALDMPDPSGNAAIVEALARLYFLTGEEDLRARAERTLAALGGGAVVDPLGTAGIVNAADTLRRGLQIVIVGRRGEADTDALMARAFAASMPARALLTIAPGARLPDNHPAFGKERIDDRATAYVCRGAVCSLPAASADELAETIRGMRAGP
ncbi:MAG: thioredoxin domain-containing protein [Alphaproteobacteria bacterium]|nr:thioredoxin domain-containing protein [Alphaproteobacteria bacterium]